MSSEIACKSVAFERKVCVVQKCLIIPRVRCDSNLQIFPFNLVFQIKLGVFQFANSVIVLLDDTFNGFCGPIKEIMWLQWFELYSGDGFTKERTSKTLRFMQLDGRSKYEEEMMNLVIFLYNAHYLHWLHQWVWVYRSVPQWCVYVRPLCVPVLSSIPQRLSFSTATREQTSLVESLMWKHSNSP